MTHEQALFDGTTFKDTHINARETTLIEQGLAGEAGFIEQYGTQNGEKTVDIRIGEAAGQAAQTIKEGATAVSEGLSKDPVNFTKTVAEGVWDITVNAVTNPMETFVYDDSKGSAADRQLVAELQGNAEAAKQEAGSNVIETVSELTPPGVGKAFKHSAEVVGKETVEVADKFQKDILKFDSDVCANATCNGYVNGTKINQSGKTINNSELTSKQQGIVADIIRNGDQSGAKTEALTSDLLAQSGYKELSGNKYGGEKGIDHILQDKDGVTTVVLDAKQLNKSGGSQLGKSGDSDVPTIQLSDKWLKTTADRLPPGEAKTALEQAIQSGSPIKTVITAVDKKIGDVKNCARDN
ncbi:hypothetical protein [Marinomonas epiphytica]